MTAITDAHTNPVRDTNSQLPVSAKSSPAIHSANVNLPLEKHDGNKTTNSDHQTARPKPTYTLPERPNRPPALDKKPSDRKHSHHHRSSRSKHKHHRHRSSRHRDDRSRSLEHRSRSKRNYDDDRHRSRSRERHRHRHRSHKRSRRRHRSYSSSESSRSYKRSKGSRRDKEDLAKVTQTVLQQQSVAQILAKVTSLTGGASLDPNERLHRELYVGGIPVGMSAPALIQCLNEAMRQYGLAGEEGNAVLRATLNGDGSYAFVEMRTVEETDACITSLNGFPILGCPIKIGRPRNYTGNGPTSGTFNPTMMVLPSLKIDEEAATKMMSQLERKIEGQIVDPPSEIVEIRNLVNSELVRDRNELKEIGEEILDECKSYGNVQYVLMPEENDTTEVLCVYVEMSNQDEATAAIEKLNGRTFDGRALQAKYFPRKEFNKLPKTTTSCGVPSSAKTTAEE